METRQLGQEGFEVSMQGLGPRSATEIELSDEDLRRLDEAAPPGVTAGERYPDMSTAER